MVVLAVAHFPFSRSHSTFYNILKMWREKTTNIQQSNILSGKKNDQQNHWQTRTVLALLAIKSGTDTQEIFINKT